MVEATLVRRQKVQFFGLSDFADKYLRKGMSSSRGSCCQMCPQLCPISLPSLRQKAQKMKKNSGSCCFFHFPVAKALKKNYIDIFLIFVRYWGPGSQNRSAQWVFINLSDFAVEYFQNKMIFLQEFLLSDVLLTVCYIPTKFEAESSKNEKNLWRS